MKLQILSWIRLRVLVWVLAGLALLVILAVITAPMMGRWYIQHRLFPSLGKRLSRSITVQKVSLSTDQVVLYGVIVSAADDQDDAPMATIPEIIVAYELAPLLRGKLVAPRVDVQNPRFNLVRHADGKSNFLDLLDRRGKTGGGGPGRVRIQKVSILDGSLNLEDRVRKLMLSADRLQGELMSAGASAVTLAQVQITSARVSSTVFVDQVKLVFPAPRQIPVIHLQGGQVRLLPSLNLSGIRGTLRPDETQQRVRIAIDGSYGGAQAKLWSASGWLMADRSKAVLRIEGAQFSLGRIASILQRTPVIHPQRTLVDGWFEFKLAGDILGFSGKLAVERLSLFHPMLARTPILDLAGLAELAGRVDLGKDALALDHLTLSSRGVTARLSGRVERLTSQPLIALDLEVPKLDCQTVLDAFPPSLMPKLQGFELSGQFSAHIQTRIDYQALDEVELGGKVDINRCKVDKAPEEVNAERFAVSFDHQVELAPEQFLAFTVGPPNQDFVPYDLISPNIISAFLTTEDGGFFRHRGYIPSMFKKALSRNLKHGKFRLGASTITMQMVKNVLLSPQKTLSRKLQELFLVWYLEQNLTKERIMEIYLNVIEFGPGIYGIGKASRHYFGKEPREISPLEAAFFSSILPSPKRRYIQYCNGELSQKWDKYVRRILRRMAGKGFVDPLTMASMDDQRVIFYRDLATLTPEDCQTQLQELLDLWEEENLKRYADAISRAAPHQLDKYITESDRKRLNVLRSQSRD